MKGSEGRALAVSAPEADGGHVSFRLRFPSLVVLLLAITPGVP